MNPKDALMLVAIWVLITLSTALHLFGWLSNLDAPRPPLWDSVSHMAVGSALVLYTAVIIRAGGQAKRRKDV